MKTELFNLIAKAALPLYKLIGGIEKKVFSKQIKILLIKPDHLGDVVLTTAAIEMVKNIWPNSIIWFMGKEWVLPILEHNPHIDRLIPFSPNWGAHNFEKALSLPQITKLARKIRKEKFDLSISFQEAPMNHLFATLCGIPERAGYSPRGGKPLLTFSPEDPGEDEHALKAHRRLVKETAVYLNIDTQESSLSDQNQTPKIYISDEEKNAAKLLLKTQCNIEDKFVAFHIGAGNPGKEISVEKAAQIAMAIVKDTKHKLLLTAGPSEVERLNNITLAIEKNMNKNADFCKNSQITNISTLSSLTVRELAAVLSKCSVYVGHDSGPSHIAAAMNVPVITMWGPGNPDKWAPKTGGTKSHIVRHQVCDDPPKRPICLDCKCLNEITGDEIAKLCVELIE